MRKILIYVGAIVLLAAGYPILIQQFGNGWLYFIVVAAVLLAAKVLANGTGRK